MSVLHYVVKLFSEIAKSVRNSPASKVIQKLNNTVHRFERNCKKDLQDILKDLDALGKKGQYTDQDRTKLQQLANTFCTIPAQSSITKLKEYQDIKSSIVKKYKGSGMGDIRWISIADPPSNKANSNEAIRKRLQSIHSSLQSINLSNQPEESKVHQLLADFSKIPLSKLNGNLRKQYDNIKKLIEDNYPLQWKELTELELSKKINGKIYVNLPLGAPTDPESIKNRIPFKEMEGDVVFTSRITFKIIPKRQDEPVTEYTINEITSLSAYFLTEPVKGFIDQGKISISNQDKLNPTIWLKDKDNHISFPGPNGTLITLNSRSDKITLMTQRSYDKAFLKLWLFVKVENLSKILKKKFLRSAVIPFVLNSKKILKVLPVFLLKVLPVFFEGDIKKEEFEKKLKEIVSDPLAKRVLASFLISLDLSKIMELKDNSNHHLRVTPINPEDIFKQLLQITKEISLDPSIIQDSSSKHEDLFENVYHLVLDLLQMNGDKGLRGLASNLRKADVKFENLEFFLDFLKEQKEPGVIESIAKSIIGQPETFLSHISQGRVKHLDKLIHGVSGLLKVQGVGEAIFDFALDTLEMNGDKGLRGLASNLRKADVKFEDLKIFLDFLEKQKEPDVIESIAKSIIGQPQTFLSHISQGRVKDLDNLIHKVSGLLEVQGVGDAIFDFAVGPLLLKPPIEKNKSYGEAKQTFSEILKSKEIQKLLGSLDQQDITQIVSHSQKGEWSSISDILIQKEVNLLKIVGSIRSLVSLSDNINFVQKKITIWGLKTIETFLKTRALLKTSGELLYCLQKKAAQFLQIIGWSNPSQKDSAIEQSLEGVAKHAPSGTSPKAERRSSVSNRPP